MVPVDELVLIPFFQGLPAWALRHFSAAARLKSFDRGEYIVKQHDQAGHVFFLRSGVVQIYIRFEGIDDLFVGALNTPGGLIGWSSFRIPYRYTASVRCEESSSAICLARSDFDEIFQRDPRLGYTLLQRVASTLANRLEQIRDLMARVPGSNEQESAGV